MTGRAAEDADYIGEMTHDRLKCRVWVDRFVGDRRRGARNHLPAFVNWWKANGNGSRELIYSPALPMAVSIEGRA